MFEEIQIPLRSGNIAACWYGRRDERPILALHGWQDNAGSFALLAPLLSKYAPILAIDFPGHGKSTHFPTGCIYHTLDYVRCIKEIMLIFKWNKISIIGHSMGAALTYHFTSLFPDDVDLIISLDVLTTRYFPIKSQIYVLHYAIEKFLKETDRTMTQNHADPPSYDFKVMEELLHNASEQSVDINKAKHILARNVSASGKQSQKYYFSRDGRVKYMLETNTEPGLCLAMAKRMNNINWLVLKAADSYHMNDDSIVTQKVISTLKQNNPKFEYHVIPNCKHHLHLNNPEAVANMIIPFLKKYRKSELCQLETEASTKIQLLSSKL